MGIAFIAFKPPASYRARTKHLWVIIKKLLTKISSLAPFRQFAKMGLLLLSLAMVMPRARAATITKLDNADPLNRGSSWSGGIVPSATSIALWNSVVSSDNTIDMGGNLSWLGVQITNSMGLVTITNVGGFVLSIGTSGINMSSAGNGTDLQLNTLVALKGAQAWNVASTHNLTVSGVISTSSAGILTKSGAGALTLSGANTFTNGLTLSAGVLNINNATALGANSSTFTIAGNSTIDNTSSGAITLSNTNAEKWNANFTFTGTQNLNTGTGAVTLGVTPVVTVTNGTLTVDGSIGGSFGLTKAGAGTLVLGGAVANTFTGVVTVSNGTLVLNHTAVPNTTISGSTIMVNTGGTLLSGASDQIKDTTNMTLAGGTWNTAGFDEKLGALTLSANSTLDLASGTSVIQYAASSGNTWTGTLKILNWTGSATGGGSDQVLFGATNGGLSSTQLSDILFVNPTGFIVGNYSAKILSGGEIVPFLVSPEPATTITGAVLVVLLIISEARRCYAKA